MADDDDMQIDQWDNTIGDDDELDTVWTNLTTAAGTGKPAEVEQRLATHLASLGPRWRRTGEGLIIAASEASGQTRDPAHDWRVTLHRFFIRDRPLNAADATAALIAHQKTGRTPNWHTMKEQVPLRILCAYVRDMRAAVAAGDAQAALYELASELFDFSMILSPEDAETLRNDRDVAMMMTDILAVIAADVSRTHAGRGSDVEKARALVEVTIKQLAIASDSVH